MNLQGLALPDNNDMTKAEVNKFEKVQAQVEGLYKEIGLLSRKSPNDGVNKFKLKFINQILQEANRLLIGHYKPLDGFENFEVDEVPSNSDVAMILELYLNCLEKLRTDNVTTKEFEIGYFWIVDSKPSNIKTQKPKKLDLK